MELIETATLSGAAAAAILYKRAGTEYLVDNASLPRQLCARTTCFSARGLYPCITRAKLPLPAIKATDGMYQSSQWKFICFDTVCASSACSSRRQKVHNHSDVIRQLSQPTLNSEREPPPL